MIIIPPQTVTDDVLSFTSAAEPGPGEQNWNSGTSFSAGDKVIIASLIQFFTVISIASPAVVTWSGHGLPENVMVSFQTTGQLPTGITAGTPYYAVNVTSTSFNLAASPGGVPIATTGTQSGNHTVSVMIHRLYESLIGSNLNNWPPTDSGTNWTDIGPSNAHAMFDYLQNTATTVPSPLTVFLHPGQRVDALGLTDLSADQVSVTVTYNSVQVYSYSAYLNSRCVTDAYSYFFGPFGETPSVELHNLPPVPTPIIAVTLSSSSGTVSCGALVIGQYIYVGKTQYNAESDAKNYSTIDRDIFGNAILVPRRSVPQKTVQVRCDRLKVRQIENLRYQLNAVPALWSGLDDQSDDYFQPLLCLGVYTQFKITLDRQDTALVALEIEEI